MQLLNNTKIPVETLILWEQHYRRGDYKAIATKCNITPRQLVDFIHNGEMPEDVMKAFTDYYTTRSQ